MPLMHDLLRQRLLRRIENLPDQQIYQVLDFIEFLESKYARDLHIESSGWQKFAEDFEDKLRQKAVHPSAIREALQLIAAADGVLSSVSSAGRQLLRELRAIVPDESRTGPDTPLGPGRQPEARSDAAPAGPAGEPEGS